MGYSSRYSPSPGSSPQVSLDPLYGWANGVTYTQLLRFAMSKRPRPDVRAECCLLHAGPLAPKERAPSREALGFWGLEWMRSPQMQQSIRLIAQVPPRWLLPLPGCPPLGLTAPQFDLCPNTDPPFHLLVSPSDSPLLRAGIPGPGTEQGLRE